MELIVTSDTALLAHVFEEPIMWDSTDTLAYICHAEMEEYGLSINTKEGIDAADDALSEFISHYGMHDEYDSYFVFKFLCCYEPA